MAIVDVSSLPVVPWKNGGGVTRNLAIWPAGAGFDDFVWRVSVADVERSGDFSVFAGVDRTILLLEGRGILLQGRDGPPHPLTKPFLPYTLRGDDPIHARLVNGRVRDFNVMVRRETGCATVDVWDRDGVLGHGSATAIFFCARGAFRVAPCDGEPFVVPAAHALTLNRIQAGLRVAPQAEDSVLIGAFLNSAQLTKV
jgi:uncharacterized protein